MPEEPTSQRIAHQIAGALQGAGYQFDPTVIVAIVLAIIKLFQGCNLTPERAESRASKPRLLDRVRLQRIIRQHSSAEEEALEAAFLDAGNDLTSEDVRKLYKEIAP